MISKSFVSWYDEMRASRDDRLDRNFAYSEGFDQLAHLKGPYRDFRHLVSTFDPDGVEVEQFFSPSFHEVAPVRQRVVSQNRTNAIFEGATRYGPTNVNRVTARIFLANSAVGLVIIPHWHASAREYFLLGRLAAMYGVNSAVLSPVHHDLRTMPGEVGAGHFVSSNLGRTVRAVQQSVCDAIDVADTLRARGINKIVYLGASLGSCIAGLAAVFDSSSAGSALLLTAGNFADVVWMGRVTRHIRQEVGKHIDLVELRNYWRVIATEEYISRIERRRIPIAIFSGRYDEVILPCHTKAFVEKLRGRTELLHLEFACGHHSMSLPPFNLSVSLAAIQFTKDVCASSQLLR